MSVIIVSLSERLFLTRFLGLQKGGLLHPIPLPLTNAFTTE